VVARLMVLASSPGNQRAVFFRSLYSIWENSDVNLFPFKEGEIVRKWYVVDANGQTLGRLASQVARILMGKENPQYTPFLDTGDHVIVVNAEKIQNHGREGGVRKSISITPGIPAALRTEDYNKRLVRKPEAGD
jgi:ribosomal protein L13